MKIHFLNIKVKNKNRKLYWGVDGNGDIVVLAWVGGGNKCAEQVHTLTENNLYLLILMPLILINFHFLYFCSNLLQFN